MGAKAETLGLVAFETLPWACRLERWGRTSTVLGVKDSNINIMNDITITNNTTNNTATTTTNDNNINTSMYVCMYYY